MINKFYSIILLAILFTSFTESVFSQRCPPGSVLVRGHRTKRGKFVKPHCRTRPNKTKRDNWSTKGNRNPVTKKRERSYGKEIIKYGTNNLSRLQHIRFR
jgi:hypothetical protein